jgi:hypothetical protein
MESGNLMKTILILTADISEKTDPAARNPDLVRQLHAKLEAQSANDNHAVPNRSVSP